MVSVFLGLLHGPQSPTQHTFELNPYKLDPITFVPPLSLYLLHVGLYKDLCGISLSGQNSKENSKKISSM